jgi:NAD(P)H dehydrogenase (quinone)
VWASILFSRSPHQLAELTELGAHARATDFDRPDTLAEAFAGVDVLLLISTDAVGRRAEQHRAAIIAAAAVGVQRIAYTSMPMPRLDQIASRQ